MITKPIAERELRRMTGFDFFPSETEAIKEMLTAIQSAATEAVAVDVVGDLIRNATDRKCPTPGEIWRAMRTANPAVQAWKSSYTTACPDCGDTGWVSEDRGGIAFSVRCAHPNRGRAAQETLELGEGDQHVG